MKKNVGSADRIIRIIIGIVLLSLTVIVPTWWGLIGIIPLTTAFLNFCPLYTVFGMSTDKKIDVKKL